MSSFPLDLSLAAIYSYKHYVELRYVTSTSRPDVYVCRFQSSSNVPKPRNAAKGVFHMLVEGIIPVLLSADL
jgi:hypothetical protein